MKKSLIIFLVLGMLVFCACTNDRLSAPELMERVKQGIGSMPDCYIFTNTAGAASEHYITHNDLGYLYYNKDEAPEEMNCIESFSIALSKADLVYELHIIKTHYQSDTDKIERMLARRAKLLTTQGINPHDSEFFGTKAKNALVFSRGRYVFLCASDNTDVICRAIEKTL